MLYLYISIMECLLFVRLPVWMGGLRRPLLSFRSGPPSGSAWVQPGLFGESTPEGTCLIQDISFSAKASSLSPRTKNQRAIRHLFMQVPQRRLRIISLLSILSAWIALSNEWHRCRYFIVFLSCRPMVHMGWVSPAKGSTCSSKPRWPEKTQANWSKLY